MNAARTDAELRKQIERGLRGNLKLDDSRILVVVDSGVVHLRGSVPNSAQRREALATLRLLGVTGIVEDHLAIATMPGLSDRDVVVEVRTVLQRDHRINEKDVSVEVDDGVVVLTGLVDSPSRAAFCEEDVWPLAGVKGIENRLATIPVPRRVDPEVAADVAEALRANPWIDEDRVAVRVHDQVVTLIGTVRDREQKRLAEHAARWVRGVRGVRDDLEVAA
jgi:osmotically-inducible protein OsmY